MAISSRESFLLEGRYQRACAVCGSAGPYHVHHIVPQRTLKRLKLPLSDPRNALRLCTLKCHFAFEWAGPGKVEVPITCWPAQGVCYTWEVLGVTAVQLEKKYGELDIDPRWVAHLNDECELCQSPLATTV